jgi:hypothetical protein
LVSVSINILPVSVSGSNLNCSDISVDVTFSIGSVDKPDFLKPSITRLTYPISFESAMYPGKALTPFDNFSA